MANLQALYFTLTSLSGDELVEYLVSRVNIADLRMIEGFADFDEHDELAAAIHAVRTA